VRNTTQPRLWLEVTLMGLLPSASAPVSSVPPGTPMVSAPPRAMTSTPTPSTPTQSPKVERQSLGEQQADLGARPVEPIASATQLEAPHQQNGKAQNGQAPGNPAVLPVPQDAGDRPLIPSEAPADRVLPEANPDFDLVKVWNELIANLQPPGTQMLLRQQGRLMAFNGQEAKVGFSSQPLFKMAIERAPNIEAAFAKVYGRKIRVSLEVVAAKEAQSPAAEPAPPPEPRSPKPVVRESAAEFKVTPPAQPLEAGRSPVAQPRPPEPAIQTAAPSRAEPAAWQSEDEVSRAAKSLAQMFNGQIVSSDSQVLPGLAAELPPSQEAELIQEPDGEPDEDEDVPF
ncbi:MAG TPA: hypothetical protein V6C57_23255, partial [Coleofasciculaceae cyanobacterium]